MMDAQKLKLGQRVGIKDPEMEGIRSAMVYSFTLDMSTGELLVVVEVLGELKVVHPNALIPLKKKKSNNKQ